MNKTPFRETLLLFMVLSVIIWNVLRLWTALKWQNILNEFSARPAPSILAVSSVIWIISGLITFWAVSQKKVWAWKMLLGASASYTVWYWCERLIWQDPHPNWTFAVIVNLLAFAIIFFNKKSLSREAYERKSENPKTE